MFFPGISSQIRRQCLLPSSAGQDQSLAQIAVVEPVRARRTPARIGPPKARSMPRFHAFSNWRFFDMFAPPSTQVVLLPYFIHQTEPFASFDASFEGFQH